MPVLRVVLVNAPSPNPAIGLGGSSCGFFFGPSAHQHRAVIAVSVRWTIMYVLYARRARVVRGSMVALNRKTKEERAPGNRGRSFGRSVHAVQS